MESFRIVIRRLGSGVQDRYRAYIVGVLTMTLLIASRRYFLDTYFERQLPLRLFILPVIAAAWSGGFMPGLFTTLLGCLTAPYYFGHPSTEAIDWQMTMNFLLIGLVVSGVTESLHVTRRRLESRQRQLELEMEERRKLEITERTQRDRLAQEIEQRELAESGLREGEERIRMAVESANIGTWDLNVLTGERMWSDGSKAMFGLAADEDVSNLCLVDLLHPDDRERVAQAIQQALDPGRDGRYEAEYRARWRDGTIRWIIAKGQAFFQGEGEARRAVRLIGTVFDFTEHKQLEEALKDADRRKDEFLATLAHELRNPLAPVRNAVQILKLKGPAIPEFQWARDVIDRQMQQMSGIIDDLLDVSRISRNKLALRKERVELTKVLQGAVETSRPLIEANNHDLTLSLPPQALYLDADLTRLAQCVSNLLNNASKFTERGGHIWLTAEREGSDVVVTVKDTGIGILADQLPKIFEMFTQLDRSLERTQGGLGIGLSLVQRIVEMHGGTILVHTRWTGKGK